MQNNNSVAVLFGNIVNWLLRKYIKMIDYTKTSTKKNSFYNITIF
jgi:hypothetical protein